jgi:hypothetical protein
LLNVIFEPEHTKAAPSMTPGAAIVVIVVVTSVPQPVEYVIAAVPTIPPVTTPEPEPTVAILVLLVLHVPPVTLLLNVMFEPEQTDAVPGMMAGAVKTVTVAVASGAQPLEKEIIVLPAVPPVTIPVNGSTLATIVLPLLQVPLVIASLSVVASPEHTFLTPDIAVGKGVTVDVTVDALVQPLFVAVAV